MPKCFGLFSEVTEFARPMSRRQATNRRELLSPSLIPARHQTAVVFSAPIAATNGTGAEPPRYCNHQRIHCQSAKKASQTIEAASPELIAGNHLLARLVFQQIRPRNRSSAVMGGQSRSPEEPQRVRTPIASPDIASPVIGCAEVPAAALIPPMETLFTQLARRRLRGRTTEETR
jgi:hypothetical protein